MSSGESSEEEGSPRKFVHSDSDSDHGPGSNKRPPPVHQQDNEEEDEVRNY